MARRRGVRRLYVHAFTDGRDTAPTDGEGYASELDEFMRSEGLGVIATVCGRYYAMDRDNRWERLKLAYDALVHGPGRPTR
jgi:2,3-bisphosphoglycerate-independent phosphoglycerate mutase